MKRILGLAVVCSLAVAGAATGVTATSKDVDTAFAAFWAAPNARDAAKVVPEIVESGVTFDEAWRRLKAGRPYAAGVPKGVIKSSYSAHGKEFFYAVNVPESYQPSRRYQVRIQLHGGVSRVSNEPRGDGTIGALAGAEQIYILPYAWSEAPWWREEQIENIATILDTVKRSYNVDENRVVLCGVSDGGSGVFYVAMRDTTPYASFSPLNGFIMVLDGVHAGDLFPNNLRNKPFFIVNGGLDPLYPIRMVGPYVEHLKKSGVEVMYKPQFGAAHNTRWWPELKDSFEAFVHDHPRNPLPDTLTWESSATAADKRAHWLIIEKLAAASPNQPPLDDVNRVKELGRNLFVHDHPSGRVDLVRTGNTVKAVTRGVTDFLLLLSPDAFDFTQPIRVETNGQVAFNGLVRKNIATLFEWAARDNDRTMLYAAELRVRVR
jgi:hypothetical protein